MVTSPFHFFSRARDNMNADQVDGGDISNIGDITFDANLAIIGSATGGAISVNNTMSVDPNFDYYGGCRECYQFSMLFGRMSNNIGVISNEEDFEKYKMQFVAHFNEKHKDLYEWRKNGKKGKKPITNKEEIEKRSKSLAANSMSFSVGNGNTLDLSSGATLYFAGELSTGPVMSQRDHNIIGRLERTGHLSERDRKRMDKKYGKSVVNKARKKYSRTRQVRIESIYGTDIVRGWRS